MDKIDLRNQFEADTGKVATDNIADYADWLENRITRKKCTYLYKVRYFSGRGIAEIEAETKEKADRKMERIASAGCPPASKYSYIGIKQDEPEPFFFPDFRPLSSSGSYKKRIREEGIVKEK